MCKSRKGEEAIAQSPEATKVSEEEYQEADYTSVVGNKSLRFGKYTKIPVTEC